MRHILCTIISLVFSLQLLTAQPITSGLRFNFAIPYVHSDDSVAGAEIQILITSAYDSVSLSVTGPNYETKSFTTGVAGTVLTVDKENCPMLRGPIAVTKSESERTTSKAINITAQRSISVVVMNKRGSSSEAWRPLPSHLHGTRYRTVSYWDGSDQGGSKRLGGFIVTGSAGETDVQIVLAGQTNGKSLTVGRRKPGDTINVRLQRDEAYAVFGDGTSQDSFDLSGTLITANKPVSVIGVHSQTAVPACTPGVTGRDHLVEDLPPVSAWGKKYVTTTVRRRTKSGTGGGDVFRIVADQPDTRWSLKFYDPLFGELIGQDSGALQPGEFRSIEPCSGSELPVGVVVITANNPIMVAQYSTSPDFDSTLMADPFMVIVQPTEQFVHQAHFQTPRIGNGELHTLNLTVRAPTESDAMSVQVDGVPLWSHPDAVFPPMLLSKVPGTLDVYTTRITFEQRESVHTIIANENTTFGGFAFATGATNSYGFPVAGTRHQVAFVDTTPPALIVGVVNHMRVAFASDSGGSGLEYFGLAPGSKNVVMKEGIYTTSGSVHIPPSTQWERSIKMQPIRCVEPTQGVLIVRDHQDNVSTTTVDMDGIALEVPEVLDFGDVAPYQLVVKTIDLRNTGIHSIRFWSWEYAGQGFYFPDDGSWSVPQWIMPGETLRLSVAYEPLKLTMNGQPGDSMLIRINQCDDMMVKIRGACRGSSLEIQDRANPANHVAVGTTRCDTDCLTIRNLSAERLDVLAVLTDEHSEIAFKDVLEGGFSLDPGETKPFATVCYTPKDVSADSAMVRVVTATANWDADVWRHGALVSSVRAPHQVPSDVVIQDHSVLSRDHAYRVTVFDLLGRQLFVGMLYPGEPLEIVQGYIMFERVTADR